MTEHKKFLSRDFYRLANSVVGGWCKKNGFKRVPKSSAPVWYRPQGDQFLVFWLQIARVGWLTFIGCDFIVEFEFAKRPQYGGHGPRQRMGFLLSPEDIRATRELINVVKSELPRPTDKEIRERYEDSKSWRRSIERNQEPVKINEEANDFWLPYYTEAHARMWFEFIVERLPRIIARFTEKHDYNAPAPK